MYSVTAFYRFLPLDSLEEHQALMQERGRELGLCGLTRIAEEGINGTIGGSAEGIRAYKEFLTDRFGEITFKDSECEAKPFKRFFVKIKPEIVTIKDDAVKPAEAERSSLSPEEWNTVLENEDVVVLDTRNGFEVDLGAFENAVDFRMTSFSEFSEHVKKAKIAKDKKVLMYCTGGIRCEKAEIAMRELGYTNVFQLDGGILKYLEQCPRQKFKGECFVFDKRVALDQDLHASKRFALCPHCGDPGDRQITCAFCRKDGKVCAPCKKETCSKDCEHRLHAQYTRPCEPTRSMSTRT